MNKQKNEYIKTKFHPVIRIIASILVITFLFQDISWAYPQEYRNLAVTGLQKKEIRSRIKAALIIDLIEKRSALSNNLNNLRLDDITAWSRSSEQPLEGVKFEPIREEVDLKEVRLYINDGSENIIISYFDRSYRHPKLIPPGYQDITDEIPDRATIPSKSRIQRQVLRATKLLPFESQKQEIKHSTGRRRSFFPRGFLRLPFDWLVRVFKGPTPEEVKQQIEFIKKIVKARTGNKTVAESDLKKITAIAKGWRSKSAKIAERIGYETIEALMDLVLAFQGDLSYARVNRLVGIAAEALATIVKISGHRGDFATPYLKDILLSFEFNQATRRAGADALIEYLNRQRNQAGSTEERSIIRVVGVAQYYIRVLGKYASDNNVARALHTAEALLSLANREWELLKPGAVSIPGIAISGFGEEAAAELGHRLEQIIDIEKKAPLLSIDIDGTLASFGALLDDDTIDVLIRYIEQGGIIALNTLTTQTWVYRSVIDRLANKLGADRQYLLSRLYLIVAIGENRREGKIIYEYNADPDVMAYCPIQKSEIGLKTTALAWLMGRLKLKVSLLALLADRFDESDNDGDALANPNIPIIANMGQDVDGSMLRKQIGENIRNKVYDTPSNGQYIFNTANGGPAAAKRLIESLNALLESMAGSRREPMAITPRPAPREETKWTFSNGKTGGFIWAGIRDGGGAWDPDRVYMIPLLRNKEGQYGAVFPEGANVFTVFSVDGEDVKSGQAAGRWKGTDYNIDRNGYMTTADAGAVKPEPADMSLSIGRTGFDDVSTRGDTTNPFIRGHIDNGQAIELKGGKAYRIRRDYPGPEDPVLENELSANGTFKKIEKAKDAPLLSKILSDNKNFRNLSPDEKADLIRIVREKVSLSLILGHSVIGWRKGDAILAHTRTGFSEAVHGLEPTIWIGEKLFKWLSAKELAQFMLEEAQHILKPPRELGDGRWIHRHGTIDKADHPKEVIEHSEEFVDRLYGLAALYEERKDAASLKTEALGLIKKLTSENVSKRRDAALKLKAMYEQGAFSHVNPAAWAAHHNVLEKPRATGWDEWNRYRNEWREARVLGVRQLRAAVRRFCDARGLDYPSNFGKLDTEKKLRSFYIMGLQRVYADGTLFGDSTGRIDEYRHIFELPVWPDPDNGEAGFFEIADWFAADRPDGWPAGYGAYALDRNKFRSLLSIIDGILSPLDSADYRPLSRKAYDAMHPAMSRQTALFDSMKPEPTDMAQYIKQRNSLVFLDGKYEKIEISDIEKLEDPVEVLRDAWKHLKPNGKVIITCSPRVVHKVREYLWQAGAYLDNVTEKVSGNGLRILSATADADITNHSIRRYIDEGIAVEMDDAREKVKIIRRQGAPGKPDDSRREKELEAKFKANSLFEKIRDAKDPARLRRILDKNRNFDALTEDERERLINEIIGPLKISIILGKAVLSRTKRTVNGKTRTRKSHGTTRTGYSRKAGFHDLEPTIWIGEALLDRLNIDWTAQFLLEEAQHILKTQALVNGEWINLDEEISTTQDPAHIIRHNPDYVGFLRTLTDEIEATLDRALIIDPSIMGDDGELRMTRYQHIQKQLELEIQMGRIADALEAECAKMGVVNEKNRHQFEDGIYFDIKKAVKALLVKARTKPLDGALKKASERSIVLTTKEYGDVSLGIVTMDIMVKKRKEQYVCLEIINEKLAVNHAGRNRLTVYAQNAAKAVHETVELWHWLDFSRNPRKYGVYNIERIASKSDIDNCRLGAKIRAWAILRLQKEQAEFPDRLSKKEIPKNTVPPGIYNTKSHELKRRFHQYACMSELRYKLEKGTADLVCKKFNIQTIEYIINNSLNLEIIDSVGPGKLDVSDDGKTLIISKGCLQGHSRDWFEFRILNYVDHMKELKVILNEIKERVSADEFVKYRFAAELVAEEFSYKILDDEAKELMRTAVYEADGNVDKARAVGIIFLEKDLRAALTSYRKWGLHEPIKNKFLLKCNERERQIINNPSTPLELTAHLPGELSDMLKRRLDARSRERSRVMEDIGQDEGAALDPSIWSADEKVEPTPIKQKRKVLVICDQNMERSPLAAALINMNMPKSLDGKFDISSAAIYGAGNVSHIRQYIDADPILREHTKRVVSAQDVEEADIIFVMTTSQKERISENYPAAKGKIYLLLGREELDTGIGDYPELEELYMHSAVPYRAVREKIENNLAGIYRRLRRLLAKQSAPPAKPSPAAEGAGEGDGFIVSQVGHSRGILEEIRTKKREELSQAEIPDFEGIKKYIRTKLDAFGLRAGKPETGWEKQNFPGLAIEAEAAFERLVRLHDEGKIFSFGAIVESKEDYALGFGDDTEIGIAKELLHIPKELLAELLFHEAVCFKVKHWPAQELQKYIFSENYTFNPQNPQEERKLKTALRLLINRKAQVKNGVDHYEVMRKALEGTGITPVFFDESDISRSSNDESKMAGKIESMIRSGEKYAVYGNFRALKHIAALYRDQTPPGNNMMMLLDKESGITGTWEIYENAGVMLKEAIPERAGPCFAELGSTMLLTELLSYGYDDAKNILKDTLEHNKLSVSYDEFKGLLSTLDRHLHQADEVNKKRRSSDDPIEIDLDFRVHDEGGAIKNLFSIMPRDILKALLKEYILSMTNVERTPPVFECIFDKIEQFQNLLWEIYLDENNSSDENTTLRGALVATLREHCYGDENGTALWTIFHVLKEGDINRSYKAVDVLLRMKIDKKNQDVLFHIINVSSYRKGALAAFALSQYVLFGPEEKKILPGYDIYENPIEHVIGPGSRNVYHYLLKLDEAVRQGGGLDQRLDNEIYDGAKVLDDNAGVPGGRAGYTWFSYVRKEIHSRASARDLAVIRAALYFWKELDPNILNVPDNLVAALGTDFDTLATQMYSYALNRTLRYLSEKGLLKSLEKDDFLSEILTIPREKVVEAVKKANPVGGKFVEKLETMIKLYYALGQRYGVVGATIIPKIRDGEHASGFMRREYKELLDVIDSDDAVEIVSAIAVCRNAIRKHLLFDKVEDKDEINRLLELNRMLFLHGKEIMIGLVNRISSCETPDELKGFVPALGAMGNFMRSSGLGGVDLEQYVDELNRGDLKYSQLHDLTRALRTEIHKVSRAINEDMRFGMAHVWETVRSVDELSERIQNTIKTTDEGKSEIDTMLVDELIRDSGLLAFDEALIKFNDILEARPASEKDDYVIRHEKAHPDTLDEQFYRFGQPGVIPRENLLSFWSKKGLNLVRMTEEEIPVPPGVIISSGLITRPDIVKSEAFKTKVLSEIELVRKYSKYPDLKLLLYARSGSAFVLPGLLVTIPNLGMNDKEAEELARLTGDEWFAYDTYAEFLRAYAINILGIEERYFQDILNVYEKDKLTEAEMKKVCERYKQAVLAHGKGQTIPESMIEQVMLAIDCVYDSWDSEDARAYRSRHRISQEWGTVVILQKGVFGNLNPTADGRVSGAGAAALRILPDGREVVQGKFRFRSIGDQLMSRAEQNYVLLSNSEKVRDDEETLEALQPAVYSEVLTYAHRLKEIFGNNQLFEFTVELNKVWITQSNDDVIADDYPEFTDAPGYAAIGRGHGVSGGALRGWVANSFESAQALLAKYQAEKPKDVDGVILFLDRVNPELINRIPRGIHVVARIISVHAETLAQKYGITALYGISDMNYNPEEKVWHIAGHKMNDGDTISIDGHENQLLYHNSGKIFPGSVPVSERAGQGVEADRRTDRGRDILRDLKDREQWEEALDNAYQKLSDYERELMALFGKFMRHEIQRSDLNRHLMGYRVILDKLCRHCEGLDFKAYGEPFKEALTAKLGEWGVPLEEFMILQANFYPRGDRHRDMLRKINYHIIYQPPAKPAPERMPPEERADITIANNGMGDMTRRAHELYHANLPRQMIKIGVALEKKARKYGINLESYPHRENVWHYDIRKAVREILDVTHKDQVVLDDINGKSVTLWIEDGILVVENPNFSVNHAGRNEMAVYARDKRGVAHEMKELCLWRDFAMNPAKYGVYNLRLLHPGSTMSSEEAWMLLVGDKILEWANRRVEKRMPIDNRPVAERLRKEFHQLACQAEFNYVLGQALEAEDARGDVLGMAYDKFGLRPVEYLMNNNMDIEVVVSGAAGLDPDLLTVELPENKLVISEECLRTHSSQWLEYRVLTYVHYRRIIGNGRNMEERLAAEEASESRAIFEIFTRCMYGERFAPDIMEDLRRFGGDAVQAWTLQQEVELFKTVRQRFRDRLGKSEQKILDAIPDENVFEMAHGEMATLLDERLVAEMRHQTRFGDDVFDPFPASESGDINSAEPPAKVLILCDQNKERSPLAAHFLKDMVPPDLQDRIEFSSAAISDERDDPAFDDAIRGYLPLDGRKYVPVTEEMIDEAAAIFVMTQRQETNLIKQYPRAAHKIQRILKDADLGSITEEQPAYYTRYIDHLKRSGKKVPPERMKPYWHLRGELKKNLEYIFGSIRTALEDSEKRTAPPAQPDSSKTAKGKDNPAAAVVKIPAGVPFREAYIKATTTQMAGPGGSINWQGEKYFAGSGYEGRVFTLIPLDGLDPESGFKAYIELDGILKKVMSFNAETSHVNYFTVREIGDGPERAAPAAPADGGPGAAAHGRKLNDDEAQAIRSRVDALCVKCNLPHPTDDQFRAFMSYAVSHEQSPAELAAELEGALNTGDIESMLTTAFSYIPQAITRASAPAENDRMPQNRTPTTENALGNVPETFQQEPPLVVPLVEPRDRNEQTRTSYHHGEDDENEHFKESLRGKDSWPFAKTALPDGVDAAEVIGVPRGYAIYLIEEFGLSGNTPESVCYVINEMLKYGWDITVSQCHPEIVNAVIEDGTLHPRISNLPMSVKKVQPRKKWAGKIGTATVSSSIERAALVAKPAEGVRPLTEEILPKGGQAPSTAGPAPEEMAAKRDEPATAQNAGKGTDSGSDQELPGEITMLESRDLLHFQPTFREVLDEVRRRYPDINSLKSSIGIEDPSLWTFPSQLASDYGLDAEAIYAYAVGLSKMDLNTLKSELKKYPTFKDKDIENIIEYIIQSYDYAAYFGDVINNVRPALTYSRDELSELTAQGMMVDGKPVKEYYLKAVEEGEREFCILRECFYRWDSVSEKPRSYLFFRHPETALQGKQAASAPARRAAYKILTNIKKDLDGLLKNASMAEISISTVMDYYIAKLVGSISRKKVRGILEPMARRLLLEKGFVSKDGNSDSDLFTHTALKEAPAPAADDGVSQDRTLAETAQECEYLIAGLEDMKTSRRGFLRTVIAGLASSNKLGVILTFASEPKGDVARLLDMIMPMASVNHDRYIANVQEDIAEALKMILEKENAGLVNRAIRKSLGRYDENCRENIARRMEEASILKRYLAGVCSEGEGGLAEHYFILYGQQYRDYVGLRNWTDSHGESADREADIKAEQAFQAFPARVKAECVIRMLEAEAESYKEILNKTITPGLQKISSLIGKASAAAKPPAPAEGATFNPGQPIAKPAIPVPDGSGITEGVRPLTEEIIPGRGQALSSAGPAPEEMTALKEELIRGVLENREGWMQDCHIYWSNYYYVEKYIKSHYKPEEITGPEIYKRANNEIIADFMQRFGKDYSLICRYLNYYNDKFLERRDIPENGAEVIWQNALQGHSSNNLTRDVLTALDEVLPEYNRLTAAVRAAGQSSHEARGGSAAGIADLLEYEEDPAKIRAACGAVTEFMKSHGFGELIDAPADTTKWSTRQILTLIHAVCMEEGCVTQPIPQNGSIVLSKNLFADDFETTHIAAILKRANIELADPRTLYVRATNDKADRTNRIVVMTEDEFKTIWPDKDVDKRGQIHSSVLLLKDKLADNNYLYIEGVIRLAAAMMRHDQMAVYAYYNLISGEKLDTGTQNLFVTNPIAFAIKAVLRFRPLDVKDTKELEDCKIMVENALMAA